MDKPQLPRRDLAWLLPVRRQWKWLWNSQVFRWHSKIPRFQAVRCLECSNWNGRFLLSLQLHGLRVKNLRRCSRSLNYISFLFKKYFLYNISFATTKTISTDCTIETFNYFVVIITNFISWRYSDALYTYVASRVDVKSYVPKS